MQVGNFVFSSFCASHFSSCRLHFCVDSTLLRIQTQPWPVWCLNQWGNQLSRPDPSDHNVPAKRQGRKDAWTAIWSFLDLYRYIQYGCNFRSSKSSALNPFFGTWNWSLIAMDPRFLQPTKPKGPQNHILKFRSHRNVLRCVVVISTGGPYLKKRNADFFMGLWDVSFMDSRSDMSHIFLISR